MTDNFFTRWATEERQFHSIILDEAGLSFQLFNSAESIFVLIRNICREYFRELKILPLQSQYTYSLSLFLMNNKHPFKVNSEIHNINTRTKSDLNHPPSHLSVYQKGIYQTEIKVVNSLPVPIKDLSHNTKQFKLALKIFWLIFILYIRRIFYIQDELNPL
jgi:hypothetical protein